MSQLPSTAVYAVLGLLAALENVIPPLPTDAAVALGAFLSHRGVTTPLGVFTVIWVCNIAGAAAVYFIARRYGRRLFATRTGRRLLSPRALATIEREYLRFGVAGIFIARFLPGIRAVVAPFAGLANLSAPRAIIPMALASAAWYGGITLAGTLLGSEWDRVERILGQVNRSLGIFGALATVALLVWLWLRRRRRMRHPIWAAVDGAFDATPESLPWQEDDARRAAALLLLEVAYAEHSLTAAERADVSAHLRNRWGLAPARRPDTPATHPEQSRLDAYSTRIMARFGPERRIALVERMWSVALEGAGESAPDAVLVESTARLLGFSAEDARRARVRARAERPVQ